MYVKDNFIKGDETDIRLYLLQEIGKLFHEVICLRGIIPKLLLLRYILNSLRKIIQLIK